MEFDEIEKLINKRRQELYDRGDEFDFIDYGAGARDENRSKEALWKMA